MPDIKNNRDYAIKKGKILEKFTEDFFKRHEYNNVFVAVYQMLIRDVDPYSIIETLIDMNEKTLKEIKECIETKTSNFKI